MAKPQQKRKPGRPRGRNFGKVTLSLDPECAKILRDMIEEEGFKTKSGAARVLIVRGKRAYDDDSLNEL